MAPTEPLRQSLPFVDDNIDILVSLFGDDDIDDVNCCVDNDDFENIFESYASTLAPDTVKHPVEPSVLPTAVTSEHTLTGLETAQLKKKPSVFKSHCAILSKQSLYRQGAISRWLLKRERRVFVKRVPPAKTSAGSNNKVVPNRSGANGRFVKSTRGFISITQAQNSGTVDNADNYSCQLFSAN